MSALGQKATCRTAVPESDLPQEADIAVAGAKVRSGPGADMAGRASERYACSTFNA